MPSRKEDSSSYIIDDKEPVLLDKYRTCVCRHSRLLEHILHVRPLYLAVFWVLVLDVDSLRKRFDELLPGGLGLLGSFFASGNELHLLIQFLVDGFSLHRWRSHKLW
jgi:hypothetical protein